LVEVDKQFRQISLEVIVDLVNQLTEFGGDLWSQIPVQEMDMRALISETVRDN